ncbi:hypothetical protein PC128_g13544 [Phytophthora cactorum]|nr:hypothetical protein PC120_g10423 [Phytophthora cactorum]KAG3062335.1 hypothetical protein PC121_g12610 [Phytophthora cactorum]KAG3184938.1 hypothetical protein PC128_g13544 [Phytophthora cactorum]KAG4059123.1 hypothetical protein PC123_g5949 [Phytophthora cactorum]
MEGYSSIDQGSNASTTTSSLGKTGITASNVGNNGQYTGSAVEGSSAIDQGSSSVPETSARRAALVT